MLCFVGVYPEILIATDSGREDDSQHIWNPSGWVCRTVCSRVEDCTVGFVQKMCESTRARRSERPMLAVHRSSVAQRQKSGHSRLERFHVGRRHDLL